MIRTDFETLFPIKVDAELISKVLSNLIDNAIKYSPENTSILIKTAEIENHIEITIEDQGIGIPNSELENVFNRFYRIKNDTTIKVKGTGLGLYLSRYFIEAHQGTISVESTPDQGTKFSIRLPMDLKETDLVQPGLRIQSFKPNFKEKKEHHHA